MSFEVKGILKRVLPAVDGKSERGSWIKQEFVIETLSEQYPKQICFNLWGEKVEELRQFTVEEQINVYFNIESREYNERWYTDLRAWRIEKVGEQPQQMPQQMGSAGEVGKIKSTPSSVANLPTSLDDELDQGSDDLPF
ncbi:MAG: DUF3127 domain-containing protein [Bacteroidales bacterium]